MSATQTIFDITAPTYDADRAKLIPCFDAFYRRTTDLIPGGAKRVLDLGAGTGLLSAFVRTWYPEAHIHLMDVSEPMLDRARTRLAADTNVSFEVADYATVALPQNQDAIVSASLHPPPRPRRQEGALRQNLRISPPRRRLRQCRAGRRPHSRARRVLPEALAPAGPRSRCHAATNRRLPLSPAGRPLRLRRSPARLDARSRLHRRRLLVQGQSLRRPRRHPPHAVTLRHALPLHERR